MFAQTPLSAFSDIGSSMSLSDDKSHWDADHATVPKTIPVHPEFDFVDSNVEVQTSELLFRVHEYHLNEFSMIARLIDEARRSGNTSASDRRIKIICAGKSIDFCNTFRVIYASPVSGVPTFDTAVLISTLRIASTYSHPGLRAFAVSGLERIPLPAIKRIELSDEFSLPDWEMPAFAELCHRAEAISPSEAHVLGVERFVEIARIREANKCLQLSQTFSNLVKPHVLLGPEGEVNVGALKCDAEFSSNTKSLPVCDCRIQMHRKSASLVLCRIHTVAPLALYECHTLFAQRNEFLNQLGYIKQAACSQQKNAPDGMKIVSVENELSRAVWIRRKDKNEDMPL